MKIFYSSNFRFFGYFFMAHHLGQVIGNLISSFILTAATGAPQLEDQVQKWYPFIFICLFYKIVLQSVLHYLILELSGMYGN